MTTMHGKPQYRIKHTMDKQKGVAGFDFNIEKGLIRVEAYFPSPNPNLEIWIPPSVGMPKAEKIYESMVASMKAKYKEPHSEKGKNVHWQSGDTSISIGLVQKPGTQEAVVALGYWSTKSEGPLFPPPPPEK